MPYAVMGPWLVFDPQTLEKIMRDSKVAGTAPIAAPAPTEKVDIVTPGDEPVIQGVYGD
jgi:hypothetical protein